MGWLKLALVAAAFGLGGAASAVTAPAVAPAAAAEAAKPAFWVEQLAQGLNMPWSMAWLPNGDLLIVEKYGGVRVFRNGKLEPAPLTGVPAAFQSGQSGLLDIAVDPDFRTNHRVFLTFTEGTEDANRGAVYRARYTGEGLVDGQVIFRTTPDSHVFPYPIAGRMMFLPDKTFLLTSTDDHGRRHLSQQLDNDIAKILRLDRNGKAPKDNPHFADATARPEIYAYGVRAPLGLARDPKTGAMWEVENGPRGGDELNLVKPGGNYGWPITTYGIEYSGQPITDKREAPGIISPTVYWVPSIAPSSLAYYTGKRYPAWNGDFFVGALIAQHLRRVRIRDGKPVEQEVMLKDLRERIRDVRVAPDGYIYLLTDNPNGRLLRLRPGAPTEAEQARVATALKTPGPNLMAGTPANLKPDPVHGKQLFGQQCQACHSDQADGAGRIGPSLAKVMGRKAGTAPGYAYSAAMRRADIPWTAQYLDNFLAAPQDYVPGTAMASPPVGDRQARTDIVGYLAQISK
ncbi:MAG: hypothetical protein JWQ29_45 [Phenylobacterium sp.]|nr:hypothetical protein [Phenylobacterium sp.]